MTICQPKWNSNVNNWLNNIQTWLLPPVCTLCGAPGSHGRDLCQACAEELPHNDIACHNCALPLPTTESSLCGQCLQKPPPYDSTISLYHYAEPITHLITGLKFQRQLGVARLLGEQLADHLLVKTVLRPDCILPVPLHSRRLASRGYNQALELARPIARRLGLPVETRLCVRTRATLPQTGLSAVERRSNLRKAFSLNYPCDYRHVAIVDDVMTTGQTVAALAQLLRKAGVKQVQVWTVARAARPS